MGDNRPILTSSLLQSVTSLELVGFDTEEIHADSFTQPNRHQNSPVSACHSVAYASFHSIQDNQLQK